MKSFLSIIILSILITGCGFKPIYSSKNSKLNIVEFTNKNENKYSFAIEEIIMSLSNKDAAKKIKLEMNYNEAISIILKDSKGDPSKKKIAINVILTVKSIRDEILMKKNFNGEFNYDVQSDQFKMSQYEDNITKNLNNKISSEIIFLLGTLE